MRDISQLHPELQRKIAELKALCDEQGLRLGIAECLRTIEEQDALYAQGRTEPGSIVTYAKGSSYSSQHQWGIAFDFYQDIPGHAYDDYGFFRNVGILATGIGLGWGGAWTDFIDMPHLYLPYWGDTPAALKAQYTIPENFFLSWKDTSADDILVVDGWWGPATTKRLQQIFGIVDDGIISDQYSWWKNDNPGISAAEWNDHPTEGSPLVRNLQEMVGADIDGVIGPDTISAMQRYFGTYVDGCVSGPSALVMAIQKWCNEHN